MQEMHSKAGFRRDVNGLRAWAVVSVILFHFQIAGFSGGFIGVDIFFVISGFLMTGIVTGKLETGRFSTIDFYAARAKRIIPALLVLCAVLLASGWFFLQAPDYKQLASHVVYSLSFLSNREYLQESGYFDSASHEKWLLHTWSLSVEWQFYLILPIVLSVVWRFWPGRGKLAWVMGMAAAASFVACLAATKTASASAFFLLVYRAWEMLAGGMVFLLAGRVTLSAHSRRVLSDSGLALIVAGIVLFDKHSAWPGVNAALPVLAASMVLLANHDSFYIGNRLAQWLGDRSYSLYLWHWPVYVVLVFSEFHANMAALAAGLCLTLIFGHLSYTLVEVRSRAWLGKSSTVKTAGAIGLALAIVAAPTLAVWRTQGWPGRFPESVENIALEATNSNVRRKDCHTLVGTTPRGCHYGLGSGSAIVLGDSHADAVVTGVASALNELDIKVEQMSYSGCPFVSGLKMSTTFAARMSEEYQCDGFIKSLSTELARRHASTPVILVNRYASIAFGTNDPAEGETVPQVFFVKQYATPSKEYLEEFSSAIVATACGLARHRKVFLMRPIPEMGVSVPKVLSRRVGLGMTEDFSVSLTEYQRRNDWVWKAQDRAREQCGVAILDPTKYLCRDGRCYGSMNKRPLYFDNNHLSEYGNKLLVPMFRDAFKRKGA